MSSHSFIAIRGIHRGSNLLDVYILYTFKKIYFFSENYGE